MINSKPVVLAISGLSLTEQERTLFQKQRARGFILFKRNIIETEQVKSLIRDLKGLYEYTPLIMVDAELGQINRLKDLIGYNFLEPLEYGQRYKKEGETAAYRLDCSILAKALAEFGFNFNCAPVADLNANKNHFLKNRAFGDNPQIVSLLCQIFIEEMNKEGIESAIKHIPGHGGTEVGELGDSHYHLPCVQVSSDEILRRDLLPFINASWAMTSHIIYSQIDDKLPATMSPKVISFIKKAGFKGKLISDDIGVMKALSHFTLAQRVTMALEAGLDLILYCGTNLEEAEVVCQTAAAF